jgi:hypothetical protein
VCKKQARTVSFSPLIHFTHFLPDRENLSRLCVHAASLQQVVWISNTKKPQKSHTWT